MEKETKTEIVEENSIKNMEEEKSSELVNDIKTMPNFILKTIKKPVNTFKSNDAKKLENTQYSGVLALLTSVVFAIIAVISNSIFASEYLKFDSSDVLVNTFIACIGVIAFITVLYYVASCVAKVKINFSKLVGVTACAFTPCFASILVVCPVVANISGYLAFALVVLSAVYSCAVVSNYAINELKLEGNKAVYYNAICNSVILLAAFYTTYKVIETIITDLFFSSFLF